MKQSASSFRETGATVMLTLLRVGVGVIMIAHGWQKLMNPEATATAFAQMGIPVPALSVWLAIAGELFGGLGVLLGFLTPVAALGPACVMIVAILWVHIENGLFARNNGFELPLTILLASLYIAFRGAGPISVDALARRRRQPRRRAPPTAAEEVGPSPA